MIVSTLNAVRPESNSVAIVYVAALTLCYILGLIVHRLYFSELSKVPGPKLASSTRLWLAYLLKRGDQRFSFPDLHKQYGHMVRVAPNEVSFDTAEAAKAIYGARQGFQKTDWFKVFQGARKFDMLSERDIPTHAMNRKLVMQAYSVSSLLSMENKVDEVMNMFMDKVGSYEGKPFDISHWVQFWSFDTIGNLTFSKPLGYLEHGSDYNTALKKIMQAGTSASWVGQLPDLYTFVEKFWEPIFGSPFDLSHRNGTIRELAVNWIKERNDRGEDDKDIFTALQKVHEKNGERFDEAALRSMVSTNIFGGAETVSSTTKASIYLILKHPEVLARVREEIDMVLANHQHELQPGQPIPYSVCKKMEYLQAVLMETMRYYPANGHPSARNVVSKEGVTINGQHFEPGTHLVVYAWAIHKNKDIFGEDADKFNPSRWQGDEEKVAEMHRNFFAFGYGSGPRACMGRALAIMEISKMVATLLHRYDVHLADYMDDWKIEGSFVFIQSNINVTATPRQITI